MCHLAMTSQKEINMRKKIDTNNSKIARLNTEIETNKKIFESLNFYEKIDS